MRRVIAAMNTTLDGVCDHTVGIADEELHDHYTKLLDSAGVILYGRVTYQLMQYWQPFIKSPSGQQSMDDFARAIDKIPKIVFSNTLKSTGWDNALISDQSIEEHVLELKKQSGEDILVGSRSLIIQLMKLKLIDEYQFCIQPVVAGGGLAVFEGLTDRTVLKLIKTKTFNSGSVMFYYQPTSKNEAKS